MELYTMSVLPRLWNTVKTLVTMIPGEINVPFLLSVVAEAELAGGGFDKIFAAIINEAPFIFPDPTFRQIAIVVLKELEKVASAQPTPNP